MKILITGARHARVLKLLKAFPTHFVLMADYGEVPEMTTANYAFTSLGKLNESSIAHLLLNFCLTQSIDCILPLHLAEIKALAESKVLFQEYGIEILIPEAKLLDQYLSDDHKPAAHLAVWVKGECVFASSGDIFIRADESLNGVFTYDKPQDQLKLFNI